MEIDKIKNAKTKILGKQVIYYEELDSTQLLAKYLVKNKQIKNGTIIITDNQTNGIGTKGRKWFSKTKENITMSIVIFPNCVISEINNLTIEIAELLKKSIQELYNINLEIKSPNDLLLNNKKICGILTESNTINNNINHIIIGIGFNVNQIKFNEETKKLATSLKNEYKREFNREEIIIRFIENIDNNMQNIINK